MKRLFVSPAFKWGVGVVLGFAAVIALSAYEPLYAVGRAALFTLWAGVLYRWWPAVVAALRAPVIDQGEHLSLGIWLSFASSFALGVFAVTQKYLGYPEWMRESPILLAIIAGQIVGAAMHLTAPGVEDGRVRTRNWITVALLLALAGAMAGAMVALSLDPG